ncbi:1-aminocyclopropane-1-carboxylate synthase-like protein 1 [Argopecten irradians]|uniref:1-aminocyclopropane-1-carboxylate synthase-like protein 1 n=1 Tax=Argopecten irradians TaxID=31199 RepID=UPI003718C558
MALLVSNQVKNEELLSKRSRVNRNPDFLSKNYLKIGLNKYDSITNSQGYINLGIAENRLCEDIWIKKITEISRSPNFVSPDLLYYYQFHGTPELTETMSRFIETRFGSIEQIQQDKLVFMDGVAAILNGLAMTLADPGDVFLCPTPVFTRIRNYFLDVGGVDIYPVPMFDVSSSDDPFRMRIDILESYLQKAKKDGLNVRGLLLINPNNPTGKVYTSTELQQIMIFCKRESLHVIFDEIYALSTQGQGGFNSVLSMDILDPKRTHFVWGLSKDLGLSGFRCGVVYSQDIEIVNRLKQVALFQAVPSPTQKLINGILSDSAWIDSVYFPAYYNKAKAMHTLVKEVLDELNIPTPCSGSNAIFIWMDLSKFLKEPSKEEEIKLFNRFMEAGLFIIPGMEMFSQFPGWFRLTYTLPEQEIREGLRRFRKVLMQGRNLSD